MKNSAISNLNGNNSFFKNQQNFKENKNMAKSEEFKQYLSEQGISLSFQVIFSEILHKKIKKDKVFEYTTMRLKQIGNDLLAIKNAKK